MAAARPIPESPTVMTALRACWLAATEIACLAMIRTRCHAACESWPWLLQSRKRRVRIAVVALILKRGRIQAA
jgi:hypothetical protein